MEKPPSFIKKFSKEYSPEERQQTAVEIRNKRAEYFEQKQRSIDKLQKLTSEAQNKEKEVTEVIREIKDIETAVTEHKNSKILQILNYFEIKKFQKEVKAKLEAKEQFEQEYQIIQDLLLSIREQVQEKTKLQEAKNLLSNFYRNQEETWKQYEKNKKLRDVANVAQQYQTIFIHGINPTFTPHGNSLLGKNVDWQTKLKILLSLEPTISASTIKEGDTHRNMWSRMGVILNGGFVLTASPGDIGTQAKGIKKRETGGHTITGRIENDIKIAISRKGEHYNELVVEDPKIAGFYISLDDTGQIIRNDLVPSQEIADTAKKFGLPFYAIQNGIIYKADYDFENKSVISKEKMEPEQLIQKQFKIPEIQKEKILKDLFSSEPPFNVYAIKSQVEAFYIDSRNQGQETYIEINASKNPSGFKKEYKEINGEQFGIITELQEIEKRVLYYIEKGQLVKRQKYRNEPRIWEKFISKFDEWGLGYIEIGFNTHQLGRRIDNNEDYLSGMEKSIQELKEERREAIIKEKYKGQTEFYNEWLDKLAFHLYGFGEQAKQFGDIKSQERVFKLANQIMPYDKYQEILKRRTDEQGRFKITMEDLI